MDQLKSKSQNSNEVILFTPRPWQKHIINNLLRYNVIVVHRRAGKSNLGISLLVKEALKTVDPMWFGAYVAPTRKQAKNVAWKMLKHMCAKIEGTIAMESELKIIFATGAEVMLLGATDPDALRGIGLDYVIMDEVAQMHPAIWDEIIQPAISDRLGVVVFIGTPKGENFFYELYTDAYGQGNWYRVRFDVNRTKVISQSELDDRKKNMSKEAYAQEYMCNFESGNAVSYYDNIMVDLKRNGKITSVPYNLNKKVYTAWDIGYTDSTAIWFYQKSGFGEVRVIDYYENQGEGLPHYVKLIKDKPYIYKEHFAPHDMRKHEFGTGKRITEVAGELGIRFKQVKKIGRQDGIEAVRVLLPSCVFDEKKCAYGIKCLKHYQKKWNEILKVYTKDPIHDFSSHGADAFRYLAVSYDEVDKVRRAPSNYLSRGR